MSRFGRVEGGKGTRDEEQGREGGLREGKEKI
jgi:hypothetical protein